MEQQTISVAKAGIVCKLNSRATVVAVMNPKGAIYDTSEPLTKNTNISSPLLSRFDLIFVLLDGAGVDGITQDKNVSTFLLNHAIEGHDKLDVDDMENFAFSDTDAIIKSSSTKNPGSSLDKSLPWSMDKLRAYIATVKEKFHPKLSSEAAILLQGHYQRCRSSHSTSVHITVRFLESLIRLSQAHARLMYRNIVEKEDAAAVILIMECSAATSVGLHCSLIDENDNLFEHPMNFESETDDNADELFHFKMKKVLNRYFEHNDQKEAIQNGNQKFSSDWDDIQASNNLFMRGHNGGNNSQEAHTQSSQHIDTYGRNHFVSPSKTRVSELRSHSDNEFNRTDMNKRSRSN